MLILLDHSTPAPLRYALKGHVVVEAVERGWERLANSALLDGECLPADNSINTGPSEKILDKSAGFCHREMHASPQSRWLLGSGEGTRTESRVPAAAIGARTGGERALAEATGTSAASQQAQCRTVFQGGTQK